MSRSRDALCKAVYRENCTRHHALEPMCWDAARLIERLQEELLHEMNANETKGQRIEELENWQRMVCELPTIEQAEARAKITRALAFLAKIGGRGSTGQRLAGEALSSLDMALTAQTRKLMERIKELERIRRDEGKYE
jgi:hypothetical protein